MTKKELGLSSKDQLQLWKRILGAGWWQGRKGLNEGCPDKEVAKEAQIAPVDVPWRAGNKHKKIRPSKSLSQPKITSEDRVGWSSSYDGAS